MAALSHPCLCQSLQLCLTSAIRLRRRLLPHSDEDEMGLSVASHRRVRDKDVPECPRKWMQAGATPALPLNMNPPLSANESITNTSPTVKEALRRLLSPLFARQRGGKRTRSETWRKRQLHQLVYC
ncbi:hypothetical protein MRX96_026112 [Rhipicephalus microplus]